MSWCANDLAVRLGDLVLLHLAGDAFLDQVVESQAYFGDLVGGDGGLDGLVDVGRQHCAHTSSQ